MVITDRDILQRNLKYLIQLIGVGGEGYSYAQQVMSVTYDLFSIINDTNMQTIQMFYGKATMTVMYSWPVIHHHHQRIRSKLCYERVTKVAMHI